MTLQRLTRRVQMLTAYAVLVTLGLVAVLLTGATSDRRASFTEIDVERINVRKPDGRLSVVVSNEARMPGVIHGGEEWTDRADTAGLLFYNGEGDETGGLTFGSTRTDSTVRTFGHLSFDGVEQDQTLVLNYSEEWADGERTSRAGGLRVVDRDAEGSAEDRFRAGRQMQSDDPAERAAGRAWMDAHSAYGEHWSNRVVVGAIDGRAYVGLNDAQARERLRLTVGPDGAPRVEMLDAEGAVVRSLSE